MIINIAALLEKAYNYDESTHKLVMVMNAVHVMLQELLHYDKNLCSTML